MITPAEMETCFVAWAQVQDDVRAAFVVGSQARRDHPADPWSDLDLILFVTDVERRLGDLTWVESFAPLMLSVVGRTVAGEPERLALYAGGLQVDFVFNPHTALAAAGQMLASGELPDTIHRGVRLLVDKDNLIPILPAPGQPPATPPPTQAEFTQALEAFWFAAVYCAKQLRRGELWMFQNASGGMLWNLLRMVEWTARAAHGWQHDTWHAGKFIAEWADPLVYTALRRVWAQFDEGDGWRAMQARLDLFHRLARELSGVLGFSYPAALEGQIIDCVRRLQGSAG